jgi:hypothetical protein
VKGDRRVGEPEILQVLVANTIDDEFGTSVRISL